MAVKPSIHEKASILRDSVYAASDGVVTTFVVVAGAASGLEMLLVGGSAAIVAYGVGYLAENICCEVLRRSYFTGGGEMGEQKGHETCFADTYGRGCYFGSSSRNRIYGNRHLVGLYTVAFGGGCFSLVWGVFEDGKLGLR